MKRGTGFKIVTNNADKSDESRSYPQWRSHKTGCTSQCRIIFCSFAIKNLRSVLSSPCHLGKGWPVLVPKTGPRRTPRRSYLRGTICEKKKSSNSPFQRHRLVRRISNVNQNNKRRLNEYALFFRSLYKTLFTGALWLYAVIAEQKRNMVLLRTL